MDNRALVSIIKAHRRDSLGYEDGELSQDRAEAMDRYHGRPYGNEVKGRSQVVSRDLSETVDWAMPAIMKAFVQSGAIAEFDPTGPEDEQGAQQESDYTNQVIMKDNPGFLILHDLIKDTLLLRNGYGKHWWADEKKISEESYTGLTLEQITQLLDQLQADGAEVEIVGQESQSVDIPGTGTIEVFDIKLKITRKHGRVRIEAAPPEEIRVSKKCRGSLQDSPFTEHVTRKTRSDLIEMGMPRSFVDGLKAYNEDENSVEVNARNSVKDETDSDGHMVNDRSMDEIEFCEAYIRVDFDEDGVAELRKVVTCDNEIPPGDEWNMPIEAVAMTGLVAKRVPHRHVGESLYDELADLMEIQTVLKRQLLDNIYLLNNGQYAINDRVNIKDMMSATPGGIKRVKGMEAVLGSIVPLDVPPIVSQILPVIDYMNQSKEMRTGISKQSSGMDPDVLRESTKGAFLENLNRASQKIEMITRMLAEGVKEMVLQVHGLLIRHQDKPRMVQLRGKWTQINPSEWKERTDLTIRVGLGTGNEEEKRQKLLLLAQMQDRIGPHGLVGPNQMYSLFEDIVKALGFDMAEKYALSPESQEFQQIQEQRKNQPNPQMQIEQMKVQAQGQAKAAELAQQGQLEQARMSMQAEVDRNRQQVEAQQQQAKMMMERELDQFKAQLQSELEMNKARLQAETQIMIARINAESKIDAAQLSAQSMLTPMQEQASDMAVGPGDSINE